MKSFNFQVGDTMVHRASGTPRTIVQVKADGYIVLSDGTNHRKGFWSVSRLSKLFDGCNSFYIRYKSKTDNYEIF